MPTCRTCRMSDDRNPREWHHMRHPFVAVGDDAAPTTLLNDARPDDMEITPIRFPFDPVLRQALIDKGVLTPDDLKNAEAKILVITGQFQEAAREAMRGDGQQGGPDDSPGIAVRDGGTQHGGMAD